MNQAELALALQTTQSAVSKWERGAHKPTPDMLAQLAKLAPDLDKFFFLEEAGIPKEFFYGTLDEKAPRRVVQAVTEEVYQAFNRPSFDGSGPAGPEGPASMDAILVPLLSDAIAAGAGRVVDEKDIKGAVPFLREWLPKGSRIYAVPVSGDSMEPTLADGYIAFVDVTRRDPSKLIGRMVAARVGDGSTIKWLRMSNKHYTLVPQHSSPRHEVQVMNEGDDWAVIGEVVRWIGQPPPPPPKRGK